MICPRCGTVAAGQSASCTRCGGQLGRSAPAGAVFEPPIPRAPTHRGELAQRAAGIVPQILARPKPPAAPPPPTPPRNLSPSPPHPAGPSTTAPDNRAWPPPPAVWEPGPASAPGPGSTPTPAPTPATGWAGAGSGWSRGNAPDLARSAAGWARAISGKGRSRLLRAPARTSTPANYMWQSLACILLFWPAALIAIVYSTQVNRRVQMGDMTGALRASRIARVWCVVSVVVFTVAVLWIMAGASVP